ncbi:MAG: cytidylate kinase-like family protein [Anaerovoracaceae bacterium]
MLGDNHVITIGRQLGSGGADIGKALADYLGFKYIDRELLIIKAAEKLCQTTDEIESLDEKESPLWSSLMQTAVYDMPYIADQWYVPTSRQLFHAQTQFIKEAVTESPCVLVGRCGAFLFRNYDKAFSIFLHAKEEKRLEKIEATTDVTGPAALKLLQKEDKARGKYYHTFTGKKWLDLTQYDLSINTGFMSREEMGKVLIQNIYLRFPELKK